MTANKTALIIGAPEASAWAWYNACAKMAGTSSPPYVIHSSPAPSAR